MIVKKQIEEIVDKKLQKIQRAILSAKKARDLSPSAMESHSDTTRSEKEKLVQAFEMDFQKLNSLKDQLSDLKVYEIKLGLKKLKFCIVPDGLGGDSIKEVKLVSLSSPIGRVLLNKKIGERIVLNNLEGQILDIK